MPGVFDNPKPIRLVERVLRIGMGPDDIVLDSFAGSGTTAHAVLNLNREDGGRRRFILVELEDYADSITAERVKRVIDGYGEGSRAEEGTGGGFSFYELAEPLFLPDGLLNEELALEHLASYIWFTETRQSLPQDKESSNPAFLGRKDGTSYYLLHDAGGDGTLDYGFLGSIDVKDEQYVIYADRCLIEEETLRRYGIIFKKVPRDIVRF
ncbi:DNA methyltransferase [Marispirochaeta sp.]|uniref:DNA methyltransferase n=1 Tax=Marispirochaeta sp. TaxID=2038653 RepID=UPI0029C80744|nr:DNA methyltransferase [Marispirochaeta sp.]